MIGEILSTLGLVVSGQGLIGSIRTERTMHDLDTRLREAEKLLRSLTDDSQFVRTAIESLIAFDSKLAQWNLRPVLEVKYMASEASLGLFLAHPERFGGQPRLGLRAAIEQSLAKRPTGEPDGGYDVPVVISQGRKGVTTFIVPRRRLHQEDVFGAVPLDTFDPATVERMANFLSGMEVSMNAGDQFDVQFEEEK